MYLLAEDIEKIGHILAQRYFTEQGWRYTDLALSGKKIIESIDTINEQYTKYPYLSRDWYVDNLADKSIHMATRWDDLHVLGNLLQNSPDQFDFLITMEAQRSLCIVKTLRSELNSQQQKAIENARKAGFNVYIFTAEVPDSMDFKLEEVIGGISGRVNFK